jgi:rsbT co-antagonist protein RsbR
MANINELRQALFDNMNFTAWVLDAAGVVLMSEGGALAGIGLKPGELVGLSVTDGHEKSPESARCFQRARAGEAFVATIEIEGRFFEDRYAPVRDEGGEVTAVVAVSTEVTERVLAERALERRTAELKRQADLLDLAQDAILARTADGTITYWNAGAARMYGHSAAEAVGQKATALLKTQFPVPVAEIEASLRTTGTWEGELIHTTRDGRSLMVFTRWVRRDDADGDVVLEIGRDVTQRKQEIAAQTRREEIIRAQSLAIQELSTPLIPITDEIVVMPLVGTMDTARARQVMEALLAGLAATRGKVAIIDITGINVVDTQVADALLQSARAARLLGAEVILTGIRPDVATALVRLQADLGAIVTQGTLQAGIRHALRGRPLVADGR